MLGDPQGGEQVVGPRPGIGPAHPGELGWQQYVVEDGQVVEQVEELEDHADLLAAESGHSCLSHLVDPLHADSDPAPRRPVEPGDEIEQGRLTAAGGSHDGDRLPGSDSEADSVEGRPAGTAVTLCDTIQPYQCVHGVHDQRGLARCASAECGNFAATSGGAGPSVILLRYRATATGGRQQGRGASQ